ncbi:hypothetical protein IX51_10335 [uncultured archaeon]|nr:hypothetical protein IX51_10335 [uncultured archaeon]
MRVKQGGIIARNAMNLAILTSFLTWILLPFSRDLALAATSFVLFTLLLFGRSFRLFNFRVINGHFRGDFREYIRKKRLVPQNILLGLLAGFFRTLLDGIAYLAGTVGGLVLVLALDLILAALIVLAFFYRPGVNRTLSRSFPADSESSSYVHELAENCGMKAPELRIIPDSRVRMPNAFSWSIPGGKSYIFASENLFLVLTRDEIGGIFTHELGHIKGRHSEKSFLLTSFVPLAWINSAVLPFALLPFLVAIGVSVASIVSALLYVAFRRGSISRRFEKLADIFAARNYDRDAYLSSLRKLTEIRGSGGPHTARSFASHDTLEEREKLIRSI